MRLYVNVSASGLLSFLIWIIASFVLVGVVANAPIIGYANNYDFIRLEACSGLWPTDGPPNTPVRNLIRTGRIDPSTCMPSIDLLFADIAADYVSLGETLDIRVIGLARSALLILTIGVLIGMADCNPSRLLISLIFALPTCDLAYSSYFNTLYSEYAIIAGILLTSAACCVASSAHTRRASVTAFYVGLLGSIFLVFSKEQYESLGVIFAVCLAAILAWRGRHFKRATILTLVALTGPVLFSAVSGRNGTEFGRAINFANKMDTYLWAVLPNATDVASALSDLTLPSSCESDIGVYWYLPVADKRHPCPEVQIVSRLRLLPLFIKQPQTFFNPLSKALVLSRPWYHKYLGRMEDDTVLKSTMYNLSYRISASTRMDRLPLSAYIACLFAAISSSIAAMGVILFGLISRRYDFSKQSDILIGMMLGGFAVFFGLVSSVFGDGYWELAKHSIATGLGCLVTTAAWMAFGTRGLARLTWHVRSKAGRGG